MKICCVFNYNPLYRFPIYKKMEEEFDCDFFFGDTVFQDIKKFDKNALSGYVDTIYAKRLKFRGLVDYTNISKIFNSKYSHYIIVGEPRYLVNWKVILYSKISGKKVIMWTHGVLNTSFIKRRFTRLFYSFFFKLADIILQYGEHPTPIMLDLGCKKENIKYIHNSLDTELHQRIYKNITPSSIYKDYFKNDDPTVIYIGRIQKRKKVDQIILAVEELKKRGEKINIVIVGAMADDKEFEGLINRTNDDGHIWLYGPCYSEIINGELLYNASVCVCPSQVGLTAIHSLSYGTPVITNDNFDSQMPEFEAIQPNETGSFFKEDNIEDLANHIHRWVNVTDEERLFVREKAVLNIVEKWSVKYQIDLLKTLF